MFLCYVHLVQMQKEAKSTVDWLFSRANSSRRQLQPQVRLPPRNGQRDAGRIASPTKDDAAAAAAEDKML